MKALKYLLATCALVLASVGLARARVIYSQNLVNETGLAYNNTYSLDMGTSVLSHSNVDSLSMQAVYSSATISAVTFTDGAKSTGTITVSSFSALVGAQGTNTIRVANNSSLTGVSFFLNGIQFLAGDLWSVGGSSAVTAGNIAAAINGFAPASTLVSASTTSAGVVTMTCVSSGTACNAITLTTSKSSALAVGGAKFSGGKDHAFLVIDGITLTQGTDFTAATSNANTATNIKNAIIANSTLNALLAVSTASSVVYATSTAIGANTCYGWFSSTSSALSVSNNALYGGADSAVSVSTDKVTKTNHNFTTGLQVVLQKSAGTAPTGLATGTTYYAIRNDANNFQLASSLTNAQAGIAVNVTAITGGGTFTLTPLAIAGTPSFKWQESNDNSNWNDISVSSVTMTSLAPAATTWDFGNVNYRYIRLNVVAPTQGAITLVVTGIGKSHD